jgi:outer membrane protein, heavy metal efflux system
MEYLSFRDIFFSSCSQMTTNPSCSFMEAKNEVYERTGHTIYWDRLQKESVMIDAWLNERLASPLSLDDVVNIALVNNKVLKAHYDSLGIAQAERVQASLLKNPIFSFSLRCENLVDAASIIESGIVQNFLDILLKPLKNKLAATQLEVVKSEVAASCLEIIAKTKIAYHGLEAEERGLFYLNQILEAKEASYEVARRLYEAGNKTLLSVHFERSDYEKMKIDTIAKEIKVLEAREKLNVFMGLCGNQIAWEIVQQEPLIGDKAQDFNSILNLVLKNSLDLKIAREKIYATLLSFNIQRKEIVFQEFTLGPDAEKEPGGTWYFGPQISFALPIFDVGLASKAAQSAELSKECNEYLALTIELKSFFRLAHVRFLKLAEKNSYYKNILIPLREKATEQALLQLNAMQWGVFDLLQVKQKELEVKLEYARSLRDYFIVRTELEILMSGKMLREISYE